MKKNTFFLASLVGMMGLALVLSAPAVAAPPAQFAYQTPTPDDTGRIYYMVGERDTCLGIELLTGAKVSDIRSLNQLDENCTIRPGQRLLIAVVEVSTPLPEVQLSPTPSEPTPTSSLGNAQICILLFEDINGNGMPDGSESQISGGVVSVSDRAGRVSLTGTTTHGAEPLCFDDIEGGEYNISVALPQGYNPTTTMNYPLTVNPGDRSTIAFGAQLSSQARPESGLEGGRSPLLGILGGIMVLLGAGLGVYLWRIKR